MIWPFKRDPLDSDADLLVGAVNTLAISMFPKFVDEFAFIPNDERGQQCWDFVVTIAGVFIALIRLRTLNLNEKRRLKLEKKVAACLVRLYPEIARPAFEKCKSFFDKTYYDLLNTGYEPLDLAMPGLNGLAVQQALALRRIDRPIIFLTGQGTIPDSVLAMRAGAIDFLTKPVDKSDLMSAIKSAEERDKTQRPIEARRKIVIQSVAKLTRRERQVLALMVTGQINKRIAHTLGIGEKTIKVHRSRVHQKMGVRSLRIGADDDRHTSLRHIRYCWTLVQLSSGADVVKSHP